MLNSFTNGFLGRKLRNLGIQRYTEQQQLSFITKRFFVALNSTTAQAHLHLRESNSFGRPTENTEQSRDSSSTTKMVTRLKWIDSMRLPIFFRKNGYRTWKMNPEPKELSFRVLLR